MSKDPPRRLGRGLSSLISPSAIQTESIQAGLSISEPPTQRTPFRDVATDLIDPNPNQPRKQLDEPKLRELAQSIRQHGALQPVVIRPMGQRFQLVAGERRWRAARLAGLATIPAILRTESDEKALELALVENLQREDLNAVDRARAYQSLMRVGGLSAEQVADRVGEERTTVVNYVRLLGLAPEVLAMVADGSLPMGHARVLLRVQNGSEQLAMANRIVREGWSVRRTEGHLTPHATRPPKPERPITKDLEDRLTQALGLRVKIVEARRPNTGRVVLHYHSLDDFQRLANKLGVSAD